MFFSLFFPILSCTHNEDPSEISTKDRLSEESVDVVELKRRMQTADLHIIDVRTSREFATGHIPGASHIPLNELEKRLPEILPYKNESLYLVCAVGGRSQNAQQLITSHGFQHAINVSGGTQEWIKQGYRLEK